MKKFKLLYASAVAASLAILFATVLTITAEFLPTLKEWLKGISGHHWTTKSIFTMAVYAVALIACYFVPHTASLKRVRGAIIALCVITILGTLALLGFF